jgi:hypothetical protein
MLVRQSAGGPVLSFTVAEWQAFLDGVAAGEFDLRDAGLPSTP